MKPAWLAVPCVAFVLAIGAWQLSTGPSKRTVEFPETHGETVATPITSAKPLELEPAAPVARAWQPALTPPRREAPPRPQFAEEGRHSNKVRHNGESGDCWREYEVADVAVDTDDFRARVTRSDHFAEDNLALLFTEIEEGGLPRDVDYELRDEAGKLICKCYLVANGPTTVWPRRAAEIRPAEPRTAEFATIDLPPGTTIAAGCVVTPVGTKAVQSGLYRAWDSDGCAICEGRYKNGRATGEWTYWHANGAVRAIGSLDGEVPVGRWQFWYDDGIRHANWDEAKKDDEFGGWQVWLADGTLHPCHDPQTRKLIADGMDDVHNRRFDSAKTNFTAAAEVFVTSESAPGASWAHRSIGKVLELIDAAIAAPTKEKQDGKRLLIKYTEFPGLESSLKNVTPQLPPSEYRR